MIRLTAALEGRKAVKGFAVFLSVVTCHPPGAVTGLCLVGLGMRCIPPHLDKWVNLKVLLGYLTVKVKFLQRSSFYQGVFVSCISGVVEFRVSFLCNLVSLMTLEVMAKQWKKEQVLPFFGCCTADSQTDPGRHQLHNNGSLVYFSTPWSFCQKCFLGPKSQAQPGPLH